MFCSWLHDLLQVRPGADHAPQHRGGSLALMLVAVLAAGCATTQTRWYMNGRSEGEFRGHDAYCSQRANEATNSQNFNDAGRYSAVGGQVAALGLMLAAAEAGGIAARYSACMQSMGYTRAP